MKEDSKIPISVFISVIMLFITIFLWHEANVANKNSNRMKILADEANNIAIKMSYEAEKANYIARDALEEMKKASILANEQLDIFKKRYNLDKSNYAIWSANSIQSFDKSFNIRIQVKVELTNMSTTTSNIFVEVFSEGFCVYKLETDLCNNQLSLGNYAIASNASYIDEFYIHTTTDNSKNAKITVLVYDSSNDQLLQNRVFNYFRDENDMYRLVK